MVVVKQISLLLVSLLFCQELVWAQRAKAGAAQEDDRAARKQWEDDSRADEYANSLRRRDWLKDRLILEAGMGTKFPVMGANWFGFGAGVEYITQWHFSGFLTGGLIPSHKDPVFKDSDSGEEYTLDGDIGWRVGLAYYMFPKSPIHLSAQVSYGTVFYDHKAEPSADGIRDIILCRGYEFDLSVSYLSDQWYFLQAMIGVYTIGNGLKDGGNTWGRTNDSWDKDIKTGQYFPLVETKEGKNDEAIPPVGVVFGIGIGFAFEDLFPDDTEIRRRERESGRAKQNQLRPSSSSSTYQRKTATKRPTKAVEEDEEE